VAGAERNGALEVENGKLKVEKECVFQIAI
jgi:hypothetical protein